MPEFFEEPESRLERIRLEGLAAYSFAYARLHRPETVRGYSWYGELSVQGQRSVLDVIADLPAPPHIPVDVLMALGREARDGGLEWIYGARADADHVPEDAEITGPLREWSTRYDEELTVEYGTLRGSASAVWRGWSLYQLLRANIDLHHQFASPLYLLKAPGILPALIALLLTTVGTVLLTAFLGLAGLRVGAALGLGVLAVLSVRLVRSIKARREGLELRWLNEWVLGQISESDPAVAESATNYYTHSHGDLEPVLATGD